jgi:methyltransferase
VILLRLAELIWARRNTRALLAQGAVETGSRHYPLFFLLHGAWLAALFIGVPLDARPDLALLGLFAVLQLARLWVILSLGPRWTTRIITLPGRPLVRKGPYRFLRHPNYLVVACEIAVLPLAFGEWEIALFFSAANAGLLLWRIRVEEQALRDTHRSWKEEFKAT